MVVTTIAGAGAPIVVIAGAGAPTVVVTGAVVVEKTPKNVVVNRAVPGAAAGAGNGDGDGPGDAAGAGDGGGTGMSTGAGDGEHPAPFAAQAAASVPFAAAAVTGNISDILMIRGGGSWGSTIGLEVAVIFSSGGGVVVPG